MPREVTVNFDAMNNEELVIHTPYGEVHIFLRGVSKEKGFLWVEVNGNVDEIHRPLSNIVDVRLSDDSISYEGDDPGDNRKEIK